MRETKKCERHEVKAETKRKLSYQKIVMPKEDIRVQASNRLKPSITRTLARSPTADQGVKYRKDAKFFAPQATVLQHTC